MEDSKTREKQKNGPYPAGHFDIWLHEFSWWEGRSENHKHSTNSILLLEILILFNTNLILLEILILLKNIILTNLILLEIIILTVLENLLMSVFSFIGSLDAASVSDAMGTPVGGTDHLNIL